MCNYIVSKLFLVIGYINKIVNFIQNILVQEEIHNHEPHCQENHEKL